MYDAIIIGAGISGINAAYRLQTELPELNYAILESRSSLGGTWDLFRYPGIRSDSSLWTFGFPWRPWTEDKTIADGASILKYIDNAAGETGIDGKVKFNHRVLSANWSTESQLWRLNIEGSDTPLYTRFTIFCTGYYDYDEALSASIPGIERFGGSIIHPQFWSQKDTESVVSKKVVVIGSGATAITIVPALADSAAHVTMLQRSPGYIAVSTGKDPVKKTLQKYFSESLVHRIMRLRSIVMSTMLVKFCIYFPQRARAMLKAGTVKRLPEHIPYDPHFEPKYNPWEQRLCLDLDGAFYSSLRERKASIITDTIANVSPFQIELASGKVIEADVIVTATGLKLQFGGGAKVSVDNEPVQFGEKFYWKTTMVQDVPNAAFPLGYPNASWTLGADVTASLTCRILKHMRQMGLTSATPRLEATTGMNVQQSIELSSTYVTKGLQTLPKAGNKAPWQPRSTYLWDFWVAKLGSIEKGIEYCTKST